MPVLQHRWNHPTYFVRLVRSLKPTDMVSINVGICLGAAEDMAHSSLRFGIGRFTTEAEIDFVVSRIVRVVNRLRDMRSAVFGCLPLASTNIMHLSPLWEMVQEGIDINSINWSQH